MSLSSLQLDAFLHVARTLSFKQAAKDLHITQPALSQRIINLEEVLGISLFNRETHRVTLTDAGQILRHYCSMRSSLELEAVNALSDLKQELVGRVNIVAFSTFTRSLLLPKLAEIIRDYPRISLSLSSLEIHEIAHALLSGRADFAFTIDPPVHEQIASTKISHECNVMIESTHFKTPADIYIDHDAQDQTTRDFFLAQTTSIPKYKRIFFDEIYTIIDAVALGLGRAIVPKHLVEAQSDVKEVAGYHTLHTPVFLCIRQKSFYTRVERFFLEIFQSWRPEDKSS